MAERTLTDYQHARQRTEMYLGSRELHTQVVFGFDGSNIALTEYTWVPALLTAWREIVDNSLDEIVAHGHGDTLKVSYDPETMEFEIEDNGRGVPIHEIPDVGKGPAASYMMSNPRSGRNFDDRGNVAGVNGLGAAIVNFTAEWFVLDVWRDGQKFHQRWDEGQYAKNPIHKTQGPSITRGSKTRTGTRVKFKPSAKVYPHMELPFEFIRDRMWDIAVANPDVRVYFNGTRLTTSKARRDDVIGTMFKDTNVGLIHTQTERVNSRFYVLAGFTDEEHVHSTVNNIPVLQGGPHVDEFRSLFYAYLIQELDGVVKKALKIKGTKPVLTRADVAQGLLIYNVTTMGDPHFDSQSKSRLVSEVKPDIRQGFMGSDVKGFLRRNPDWVASVIDRCRARTSNAAQRDIDKAQKAMAKTKIVSLKDATGKRRDRCVLFLAEGESAISGMMSVRDATVHGGIGLRGKIMNVHGVQPKKVLESKALSDIMNSLGLKIGTKAIPMNLRYGKLYIATDEDEDGKNITALIVNFLYTFWPELFQDPDHPFVYKFCTPLIMLVKGRERKYVYAEDYDQFNPEDWKGWQVIRAKGLARLTQPDWKNAIDEPKLIPMIDDGRLGETLDLIFNPSRSLDRQKWLQGD